jgi:hypothetical protein
MGTLRMARAPDRRAPAALRRGASTARAARGNAPDARLAPPLAAIVALQRDAGNAAVLDLLGRAGHALGGGAPADHAPGDEPFDASGLGLADQLEGHGNGGGGGTATATPARAAAGGAGGATVNVDYAEAAPTVVRRPEADIAAAHNRPGAAGWTTPSYNVTVPFANRATVNVRVRLGFSMELATEYTGGRGSVLADHEQGHVTIGQTVGGDKLRDGLRDRLGGHASFTPAAIQADLNTAVNEFVTQEGTQSRDYDTRDYPRMAEAYRGVRTPLADLATDSADIGHALGALRSFSADASAGDPATTEARARALNTAIAGLSDASLARLQYNAEFGALVADARAQARAIADAYGGEGVMAGEAPQLSDERGHRAATALGELLLGLGRFTFQPEV